MRWDLTHVLRVTVLNVVWHLLTSQYAFTVRPGRAVVVVGEVNLTTGEAVAGMEIGVHKKLSDIAFGVTEVILGAAVHVKVVGIFVPSAAIIMIHRLVTAEGRENVRKERRGELCKERACYSSGWERKNGHLIEVCEADLP